MVNQLVPVTMAQEPGQEPGVGVPLRTSPPGHPEHTLIMGKTSKNLLVSLAGNSGNCGGEEDLFSDYIIYLIPSPQAS